MCQICIPIAYSQSELCVFKVIKLDMQIRPVFADSVVYVILHVITDIHMCLITFDSPSSLLTSRAAHRMLYFAYSTRGYALTYSIIHEKRFSLLLLCRNLKKDQPN